MSNKFQKLKEENLMEEELHDTQGRNHHGRLKQMQNWSTWRIAVSDIT